MTRGTLIQSALLLAVIATLGVAARDRVSAAEHSDAHIVAGGPLASPLQLDQGRSLVYDFPRDIRSVVVGDSKIAIAVILSRRRANIIGVATGGTTISFFDAEERPIASFEVTVGSLTRPSGRDVRPIRSQSGGSSRMRTLMLKA